MIITLYKNCVLNDKYKDIFCSRTVLESYLSTLSSTTITISDTFSRNEDSLFIENVSNTFNVTDYNYMKVADNMITFYAFITRIDWLSDAYIIRYKEDIIANHFDKIKVRNGLQVRSRLLKKFNNGTQTDITLYKEPLASEGNDTPTITKILATNDGYVKFNGDQSETTLTHGNYDGISFICKLQLYKLSSGNEYTERKPCIFKVCFSTNPTAGSSAIWINNFNIAGYQHLLSAIVNRLINDQPISILSSSDSNYNNYLYEIDQIYAIPSYLINKSEYENDSDVTKIYAGSSANGIGLVELITDHGELSYFRTEINYDRKLFAIGFINKPFNIVLNGTKTKIKIVTEVYGYNLSFYMYVQNNIYEITDLFEVDMPFQSITASALQIRRMQLNLQNNELQTEIKNANIDKEIATTKQAKQGIGGFLGILGGAAQTALGLVTGNIAGIVGGISGMGSTATNTATDMVVQELEKEKIENNIGNTEYKVNQINGSLYSNASILANKVSYKTAENGLLAFYLSEDNATQIESVKALSGYIVNELAKDNLNDTYKNYLINNNTYDVLAYSEINIYGTISQNYLRAIENILLGGVRIWGSITINV